MGWIVGLIKFIWFHPEVLSVILAMLFAIAQANIVNYMLTGRHHLKRLMKHITALHILVATIVYSYLLWELLAQKDPAELIWIVSIGCAFVATSIYVYFKEIVNLVLEFVWRKPIRAASAVIAALKK